MCGERIGPLAANGTAPTLLPTLGEGRPWKNWSPQLGSCVKGPLCPHSAHSEKSVKVWHSAWQVCLFMLSRQLVQVACKPSHLHHIPRPHTVPIFWMRRPSGRSNTRPMNPADPPAGYSRALAPLACPLGLGRASGRVPQSLGGVHGRVHGDIRLSAEVPTFYV